MKFTKNEQVLRNVSEELEDRGEPTLAALLEKSAFLGKVKKKVKKWHCKSATKRLKKYEKQMKHIKKSISDAQAKYRTSSGEEKKKAAKAMKYWKSKVTPTKMNIRYMKKICKSKKLLVMQ